MSTTFAVVRPIEAQRPVSEEKSGPRAEWTVTKTDSHRLPRRLTLRWTSLVRAAAPASRR